MWNSWDREEQQGSDSTSSMDGGPFHMDHWGQGRVCLCRDGQPFQCGAALGEKT